jgi:hypothetical protein
MDPGFHSVRPAAGRNGSWVSLRPVGSPDALDPGFHSVRTHWIRGFMAFQRVRRTGTVMLMVSV